MAAAKTKSALAELQQLRDAVRTAEERVEQFVGEQRRAQRALEAPRVPLRDYHREVGSGARQPDEALERKLLDAVHQAEAGSAIGTRQDSSRTVYFDEAIEARLVGAREAVQAAEAAVPAFIRDHRDELISELTEDSLAAREELFARMDEFGAASGRWNAARNEWARCMQLWGIPETELPVLPFGIDEQRGWRSRPERTYPMPASMAPEGRGEAAPDEHPAAEEPQAA